MTCLDVANSLTVITIINIITYCLHTEYEMQFESDVIRHEGDEAFFPTAEMKSII